MKINKYILKKRAEFAWQMTKFMASIYALFVAFIVVTYILEL